MKQPQKRLFAEGLEGFSIAELMVGMTILGFVMVAALTGSNALTTTMRATESYSVGQLATVDYLTLDLRRATNLNAPTALPSPAPFPTPTFSKVELPVPLATPLATPVSILTLPLTLEMPQYYSGDGRTPNPGVKTLVTTSNRKAKKKHRVVSSRYYYHYGTLGGTVKVQYYLVNNSLYRKEGSQAARKIGEGIESVTFTSPDIPVATPATADQQFAAILANPVVQSTVIFLKIKPTRRSETQPPPLSNSTFMREYYYSDI